MLKQYGHIIWDWNGTILDDVDLGIEIINRLLAERNLPNITKEKYKNIFTIPVKDYYAKLGFDFEKEPFETVGKLWIEEYERRKYECSLYEGVLDVMEQIGNNSSEQSILSAYSQRTLEEMAKHYGVDKYCSHIAGLDNIYAAGKLHLGLELLKKIGNGNGKLLLIGDTLHDYEVAKAMGADCVLLSTGHQSKNVLQTAGIKIIDDIRELLKD
ncbi:HAD family hydrolase [Melioribacter sp. Ez-97]|uniref:HAD family hydrolase n=1 Tax=Melioribacter sp. Ez-97 TaxID=3423434 RepID=UPI003EDADD3E